MTPELRAELENLVFSVPSPYLSLDNRLAPWLALAEKIERDALERAARVADEHMADWEGCPLGLYFDGQTNTANKIASAIRALISA